MHPLIHIQTATAKLLIITVFFKQLFAELY